MDFLWICIAFAFGLAMRMVSLPPLIGYLLAGFTLHAFGMEPQSNLRTLADIGITLMLFTIGLKLNLRDLAKREIWVTATAHITLWTALVSCIFFLLALSGLSLFTGLSLQTIALIAFALSFSSTVCVVKLLEDTGEMKTRHGKVAVGALVIQDIVAVIFLALATGKVPSLWALALLLLIPARPLLGRFINYSGHGELLPLAGFFLAFGGYQLFELVHIKGDLGALAIGLLLSSHARATELSKALLSFKDLFLIGFFLLIGFSAVPTLPMTLTALAITLLLPLKFIMFFFLFTGFRLRGRTAFLASLALNNFSEFGLIVAVMGLQAGWLSSEWIVVLALSVSFSFLYTNLWYHKAHGLYGRFGKGYKSFERSEFLPEDRFEHPVGAQILVMGLGRVGRGAYEALHARVGSRVWGMDSDRERIERMKQEGMHVCYGDGEDADLWHNIDTSHIRLILIAVPTVEDCTNISTQLKASGYRGRVAAIARYEDERQGMLAAGIDNVFNFYTEAGTGFAEESLALVTP